MTTQQKRFVEEICIDGNGSAAAIRAGYSAKTARQKAYELKQVPAVAKAIQERLVELTISAEEATKHLSDIASTRLNDYMSVEEVWEQPMVKKPLSQLIAELDYENQIDAEFLDRAGLPEKEYDTVFAEIQKRKLQILRLQIELEKNPQANRVVKGDPVLIKRASVDLVKLAGAQDKGRIKKLSFNERGLPSVELYPADSALRDILEINGKLTKNLNVNHTGLSFLDFLQTVNNTSANEQP